MAVIVSRQAAPPGPPSAFDPDLGKQPTATAVDQALAEHLRLKPEDRFRAPIRPGMPTHVQPPQRVVAAMMLTEAPAVPKNYPAWRYHPTKAPTGMIVKDAEHEAQAAPASEGWVNNPGKFPPSAVPELPESDKLEMLEELAAALEKVAEPEDGSPVMTLSRVLAEREQYALQIAKFLNAPPAATIKGKS